MAGPDVNSSNYSLQPSHTIPQLGLHHNYNHNHHHHQQQQQYPMAVDLQNGLICSDSDQTRISNVAAAQSMSANVAPDLELKLAAPRPYEENKSSPTTLLIRPISVT